jgi:hypothetical protein
MRILVACEFSGVVRQAFIMAGHEAISCDLLPSELPGPHYQGDVLDVLDEGWDMMIAFPPCTYLAASGARWWKDRQDEQLAALEFVRALMNAPIPRIAIENPIGKISTTIRAPSQIIQPWWFGHGEVKTTCLWLKNLPSLKATNIVDGRWQKCWRMSESKDRSKDRSRTYPGVAQAMAAQWGTLERQKRRVLGLTELS